MIKLLILVFILVVLFIIYIVIKNKDRIKFIYEPRLGDWIKIKGIWHYIIEVQGRTFYDGIEVKR